MNREEIEKSDYSNDELIGIVLGLMEQIETLKNELEKRPISDSQPDSMADWSADRREVYGK